MLPFSLFRQIFKEVNKLSKLQAYLALIVKRNIRIHYQIYKKDAKYLQTKIKKQENHQLLEAFLSFLLRVNTFNAKFQTINARKIMIQCCFGLNAYLDDSFRLKKNQMPQQLIKLHQYKQFKQLKKAQDQQFIVKLVSKLVLGEQIYVFKNLTDFFNQTKSRKTIKENGSFYNELNAQNREYLQHIFQGKIIVHNEYQFLYRVFFPIGKSQLDFFHESYMSSDYLILNFDDFIKQNSLKQQQRQLTNKKKNKSGREVLQVNILQ